MDLTYSYDTEAEYYSNPEQYIPMTLPPDHFENFAFDNSYCFFSSAIFFDFDNEQNATSILAWIKLKLAPKLIKVYQ